MRSHRFPSPSLVVATLALFVALGGSAFAVTSKARPLTPCANGTVKGYVSFDLDNVSGSLTSSFSSDAHWFKSRYDCKGVSPQIRTGGGGIEIRFPGVTINAATASVLSSVDHSITTVNIVGADTVRITSADFLGNVVQRGFSLIVT